jgi:hypothetical protein
MSRVDSFNTNEARPKFWNDQNADNSRNAWHKRSLSPEARPGRIPRAGYERRPKDLENPLWSDVSHTKDMDLGAGLHPSALVADTTVVRSAKITTTHERVERSEEESKTGSQAAVPTDTESQGIDAVRRHGPGYHNIERQRLQHYRRNLLFDAIIIATFGVTNDIEYPNKSLVQRVRNEVDKARSSHDHRTHVRSRMYPN